MGLSSRPIPRDVLNSLRAVYSGGSLFPQLKKYTWDTYVLCQIDLSFFAPPGLKGLIIDGSNDLKYVRRIKDRHSAPFEDSRFERTMKDLPGLLALSIRRFPASWVPSTTWAQIVQVRRLRSLSVDPLYHPVTEVEFLRKLSKLPALLELRLGVRPDWEASWDLAFRGFLALQTLTLHLHDNITTILPVFASPHLISLSLVMDGKDALVIPGVLNLVAGTYRTLRIVSLEWTCAERTYTTPDVESFDSVFGGILHLKTVEEFSLSTPRQLFVSTGADDELARLAKSWPKLRLLSLYTTFLGPLTHAALLPFARNCPDLHTMHLRSVSFNRLTPEQLAVVPAAHPELRELHICNALVDFASEALGAQLISRVFPNVRWHPPAWRSAPNRTCCPDAVFGCNVEMEKLVPCIVPSDADPDSEILSYLFGGIGSLLFRGSSSTAVVVGLDRDALPGA
ncbi:hypothetical protein VTO73DRAFT_2331 [Trametes versicolor]